MTKNIGLVLMVSALPLLGSVARADANPELTAYLDSQLTAQESGMAGPVPALSAPESSGVEVYLRRVWLRVRARAGFSVSGLTAFSVIPETELLFERPPSGPH